MDLKNLLEQNFAARVNMPVQFPSEKVTMGYWAIRGLAAPMRMMAAYAKMDMEDIQYSATKKADGSGWETPAWFNEDKPMLAEKNAMINLPYIVDGSAVITQSNSCYLYLARRCGIKVTSLDAQFDMEQTLMQVFDLRNDAMKQVYGGASKDEFKKNMVGYMSGAVTGHYTKLDGFLRQKGTQYFSGEMPHCPDFHAFEMVDMHSAMAKEAGVPDPIDNFPALKKLHADVRALPTLEAYFAGPNYKLPFNNPAFASFY